MAAPYPEGVEVAVLWFGLIGAWLLVAGPVYQAALDLREQDLEHDRLRALQADVPPLPPLSPWWWLLPPVRLVLAARRSKRLRRTYFDLLDVRDVEALFTYINQATGWLFVSGGALLLALKEGYEVSEHYELPLGWYALGSSVLLALSLLNAAARIRRTDAIVEHKRRAVRAEAAR